MSNTEHKESLQQIINELRRENAKLKSQLEKAVEFIKSLQNHKQEGWFEDTLATMALKEIEEIGK